MDSLSPFLWDSFIPYNMPVYPGALRLPSFGNNPKNGCLSAAKDVTSIADSQTVFASSAPLASPLKAHALA